MPRVLIRAGYVVTGTSLHDLKAGWTQPRITCTSDATYAKVRLALSSAHLQYSAGTTFNCVNGKAIGYFWTNVGGGHRRVVPGDHMSLSMNYVRGSVELDISDDTQGWGLGIAGTGTGGPRMTTGQRSSLWPVRMAAARHH